MIFMYSCVIRDCELINIENCRCVAWIPTYFIVQMMTLCFILQSEIKYISGHVVLLCKYIFYSEKKVSSAPGWSYNCLCYVKTGHEEELQG